MNRLDTLRWSTLLPRLARYLPASLFNQLRTLPENLEQVDGDAFPGAVQDLLQATRTLEPLHRVLVQYMPRYLIELNPTPGEPYGELLEGSFIFADVTGFTALTELLARQGHARGREIMNQIMNRLFTEILDPLIASGGDLLIFAGDAALVYFPKQDNDNDVLQATRAALRMERAIVPFASFEIEFGQCSLTMSAGVERGLAYAGIVGTRQRMELLVSGPGIDGAMKAETQAEPGQVVLGPQAQAIARGHFTMEGPWVVDDLGEALGDYEISLPTRKRGGSVFFGMDIPEILKALDVRLQRVEQLAPFLPEDMLAHLVNTDRRRKLVSEFRPVAVQFINVTGLATVAVCHGPDMATKIFQRYFVRAEEIVTQHEGIISQVDAYAQGFFFLNTFGTPKAHEGTTRYAISAALQLAKVLDQINREFELESPLQQRGGITYGLVFNGEIGAQYRRESVVAGPAVNRAARLMSKAQPGQIILDADIWEDTQTAFVGERLPSVRLKGIEGPVVIVNVHEIRRGTRLQPLERPLLGRETEQAQLAQALEALSRSQQGSTWMISGETGIGKTSLISYLADEARNLDVTVLAGRCQPHGKHIPLFIWVDVLTGWLDTDESADPTKQRAHLAAELDSLGMADAENAMAALLAFSDTDGREFSRSTGPTRQIAEDKGSLLGTLGQKVEPDRTPTATLHPPGSLSALLGNRLAQPQQHGETLWKRLEERISGPRVIIKLLHQLAKQQPLLIILEDTHWLDGESAALLQELLAQGSNWPVMLVLTDREPMTEHNLSLMNLGSLPDSALEQVAQRVFKAHALDNSLGQWVCQQANGNPLYAEELCHALQQSDAILLDRETGEARWTKQAPTLPLSLHELMLARLDELPLEQGEIVKRAAIIGVSFEYEGLRRLCRGRMNEKEIEIALERVVQAGFIVEMENQTYRFNHPLMQEAIYTTLSFSRRQIWHTEIGNWLIEHRSEQAPELVAYHCLRGTDVKKAARFGRLAGDKAREYGAYAGALEYYQQVLNLQDAPVEEKRAAAESWADILVLQQDYQAAKQAYNQAIALGSIAAAGKQAILSGDLEQLVRTEFTPELHGWAEGSQAWLLAQNDEHQAALELAQAALITITVAGPAKPPLQALTQALEKGDRLETYENWLQQFAQAVLLTSS